MIDTLSTAFSAAVGVVVLIGLFIFLQRATMKRWDMFARRFGVTTLPKTLARKTAALIVISDRPRRELFATGYHKHPPVVFAIHENGLSLRIAKPFGLAANPLLLPFDGLIIQPTTWQDIAGEVVAISHERGPDAYIIAHAEMAEWIEAQRPDLGQRDYRAAARACA